MKVQGQVHFTVLCGTVGATAGGEAIALGGAQQRRLLAALLAEPGAVVSADQLVEYVWPEDGAPERARRTVMSYVSRLRGAVGADHVVLQDAGYRLVLDGASYDAAEFEVALAEARATVAGDAVEAYDRALGYWSGRAFGDDADEWWLRPVAARLEELHLVALEERAEHLIDAGRHAEAVADLERLVVEQPLRERFVELLMRALYFGGRQAEALRAFRAFSDYLADETGLPPSDALVDLEHRITLGDPTLAPTTGIAVPGYELGEVIGEGAFGTVYRATQPSVGRDVAVKVVRGELADDPRFVQRFEAEAQLVARLEHPHVVPLYDFWRRPGGAFLVFRLLRGGSLSDRISEGRVPIEDATRLVIEIGGALGAAHALGVVHRDVKPANVLYDETGNSYLADFGISVLADEEEAIDLRSAGSPLYASPEQARDGSATPASDQYALAIVVWEALAGRAPFSGASTTQVLRSKLTATVPPLTDDVAVPAGLDAVLQRASAPHPDDRYPTIADFVQAWQLALVGSDPDALRTTGGGPSVAATRTVSSTVASMPAVGANPYKGLRAFREADAADYRGRGELVERLVAAVDADPFVAVVGPSGSGKSSLVHAGVVPEFRRRGALVVSMVPGTAPMAELEAALRRVATASDEGAIAERLQTPGGLAAVAADLVGDGEQLVLVVDQFEELWTLVDGVAERDRFAALLEHAATAEQSALHVVVTLRADLYDRPLQQPGLGPVVSASTFAVTPMTSAELQDAITGPAERAGVRFEPGLVAVMIGDVVSRPGALPLLQFTLTELYERRDNATVTTSAYEELGGIGGALASRAEELYRAMGPADRVGVRNLFTQLVTPGDDNDDLRRRATTEELAGVPPEVVEQYRTNRLLVTDHHPITREPTIEVAHEALLREWPRLREWIDADRDTIRMRRLITQTAGEWEESDRDESVLYRGPRLAAADDVARRLTLAAPEREFLAAGHELADRERVETEQRTANQARQNRRLRRVLTGTAILLVVALVFGVYAVDQRATATSQRDDARAATTTAQQQALLAASQAQLPSDRALATLLALEADARRPGADTRDQLANAVLAESHLQRSFADLGAAMGVLPGHRMVLLRRVVGSVKPSRDYVQLWDWQTGRRVAWPDAPPADAGNGPVGLATTPDGATLAIAFYDGTVRLYAGNTLHPEGPPISGSRGRFAYPSSVAFSANGRTFAVADSGTSTAAFAGPSVSVFSLDADGWARDPSPGGHRTRVTAVDVSADGSVVATTSPGLASDTTAGSDVVISDTATGRTLLAFRGIPTDSIALDWSRRRLVESNEVVGASADAQWYDLSGADPAPHAIAPPPGSSSAIYALVGYDASDSRLAFFSGDRFELLDPVTFTPLSGTPILRPSGKVYPGGGYLVLDADHVLLAPSLGPGVAAPLGLWSLAGSPALGARASVQDPAYPSGDPGRFIAASGDATRVLGSGFRPIGTPVQAGVSRSTFGLSTFTCIDPRTKHMATITSAGDVDVRAGTPPFRILSHAAGVAAGIAGIDWCAWRPDGRQVAIGTYPQGVGQDRPASISLFDVDRKTIRTVPLPTGPLGIWSFAYSADSKRLWAGGPSTAGNGVFRITDLDEHPHAHVAFPGAAVVDVNADHRRMVVATSGDVRVYDTSTGKALTRPIDVGAGNSFGVSISPDGHTAAVEGAGFSWQLVDLDAGRTIGPPVPGSSFAIVGPDRWTVNTMQSPNITWNLSPSHLRAVACTQVGRNLSATEWHRYLATAGPRRATCPQFPLN